MGMPSLNNHLGIILRLNAWNERSLRSNGVVLFVFGSCWCQILFAYLKSTSVVHIMNEHSNEQHEQVGALESKRSYSWH